MHILVPIDDSEPAKKALKRAVTTYPDATFTALHVVEPSVATYKSATSNHYDLQLPVTAEDTNVDPIFVDVSTLADDHDTTIETEILVGSPARAIVQFAETSDAEQIVMGSHGRTGVSRVLLGSVAERVVRRAPISVTVVR
ncbi:universal stress protein [Natronolimnobius sp. AArcel1]|uniref:universal stress protein n=1 Tax=Natronolimnobius sp. AArcel1 TaxID=1679093 RepID=UPI0013E9E46C|nr:universal stress protein [Natronolimnobius sp. AArcel1]NGM70571.1 universal stress protein [Natronolimnobius sp. AArcel1]